MLFSSEKLVNSIVGFEKERQQEKQEIFQNTSQSKDDSYKMENLEQEELERQYHKQVGILSNAGLLEMLSNGEKGIKLKDRGYPIPTLDSIKKKIIENSQQLDQKISQGFNKLLLIPLGLDLQILIARYKEVLLKHKNNQTLLDDQGQSLNLNIDEPVRCWPPLCSTLLYFDQGSFTHKDQLEPWQVVLVEDVVDLPDENQGITISQRKQLEAGQEPKYYEEQIFKNQEQGFTPEAWLSLSITYLEEQNRQIDDFQGKGKGSFLFGVTFTDFSMRQQVPLALWYRDRQQAVLAADLHRFPNSEYSARSLVKI